MQPESAAGLAALTAAIPHTGLTLRAAQRLTRIALRDATASPDHLLGLADDLTVAAMFHRLNSTAETGADAEALARGLDRLSALLRELAPLFVAGEP